MKEEFIKVIYDCQKIIHKICQVYRNNETDREDLFQDIVYQLWKSYPQFKGEAKVSTWLYKIALNTAMAAYRKHQVSIEYRDELSEQIHPSTDETISENGDRLCEALRMLNDSEKAIATLYLEDFSYTEIASITGLTENHIGVRLNRIKIKLKKILR